MNRAQVGAVLRDVTHLPFLPRLHREKDETALVFTIPFRFRKYWQPWDDSWEADGRGRANEDLSGHKVSSFRVSSVEDYSTCL